jgi:predicted AlkP superfamily phosphohydrolase/phosphomutase
MVAGYGAPPGAEITKPRALRDELGRRWSLDDLLDRAPYGSLTDFRTDLMRGVRAQGEALVWTAEQSAADCVVAVWPHIDRAQHFFWSYRGTDHELAGTVDEVYEAMDAATGKVLEAFPDADVLVVSDHGAGPLRGDVNLGEWLVEHDFAVYKRQRMSLRSRLAAIAWALPPSVRRAGRRLAPGLARRAMSDRLAGQLAPFEWEKTRAFFGVHSDLWINLQGREASGTVPPEDGAEVMGELIAGLAAITDPKTGEPVFAGAHKREELYSGPYAHLAPDVVLDPWSVGYRVSPSRTGRDAIVSPPAPLSGIEAAWSADHRPLGIFAAAGPRIAAGATEELSLLDVCPTVLALLERPVPDELDGRVAREVLAPSFLEDHPIQTGDAMAERVAEEGFSEEEATAVASHLKDLGYIE